jgi:hypothetical protein
MDFAEELFNYVFKIHRQTSGGSFEGWRKQPCNLLHRDSAGEFARHGTAHPIANSEHEVDIVRGGLADLAQVAQLLRVKLKAKEGILIVPANFAPVRQPEPLEVSRHFALLIHDPVFRNQEGSLQTRNRSSRSGHRTGDR